MICHLIFYFDKYFVGCKGRLTNHPKYYHCFLIEQSRCNVYDHFKGHIMDNIIFSLHSLPKAIPLCTEPVWQNWTVA